MEERWIAPLEAGDPEAAWDLFIERYRRLIFGAIRRYTAEHTDVMDVFARVCEALREGDFARLRRCAAHVDPNRPFSTWLVVVVHNPRDRQSGSGRRRNDSDSLRYSRRTSYHDCRDGCRRRTHGP
jgi:hypothetical protein